MKLIIETEEEAEALNKLGKCALIDVIFAAVNQNDLNRMVKIYDETKKADISKILGDWEDILDAMEFEDEFR
ncbi:hypothetical protein Mzhil_0649 [Methanosalsum zhilinae DSM 4017]|uniref:Uncharacterized protein n=1 Tax=Methanosalsum zhilinae (strain DSM 4017 / NBRC 107636 / OCM 62 / WeN5) TaxID=679901 RepID=F7XQL3_METZD|nr:hypothetical protein [Methanosalsum zhilinae]AEH60516.1 hypothetical protein Mzhil_0649 [Methanosalsum zhilinae DSM 4017]